MNVGPLASFETAAASERRMLAMLECVGVDLSIAMPVNPDTILECAIEAGMKKVRQRCRECTFTDLCERWLAGDQYGDNSFCPNAKVFDELREFATH